MVLIRLNSTPGARRSATNVYALLAARQRPRSMSAGLGLSFRKGLVRLPPLLKEGGSTSAYSGVANRLRPHGTADLRDLQIARTICSPPTLKGDEAWRLGDTGRTPLTTRGLLRRLGRCLEIISELSGFEGIAPKPLVIASVCN